MYIQQSNKPPLKVGITTIHRIANFGSALQAYALQRTISELGYDCEIIDYIYPNSYHRKQNTTPPESQSLSQKIKKKIVTSITKVKKKEQIFSEFISSYLKLSASQYKTIESLQQSPPLYDIYVTGSDQVWNPTYMHFDPTFLLEFAPESAKKISYAASFGNSRIDDCYVPLYRKCLHAFSDISVREAAGARIVAEMTEKKAQHVLDPTLLLTADAWGRLAVRPKLKKKYILCYFMSYAYNPQPYADSLAKELMKSTGYDLVFLTSDINKDKLFIPSVNLVFDAGPREFLGWFANAEMVLSSSFHGTAFSVIFNKPFLSLVNDMPTLDCRQKNLLEELNLYNQIFPIRSPFPEPSRLQPDYAEVNERLEGARQRSVDFLANALSSM